MTKCFMVKRHHNLLFPCLSSTASDEVCFPHLSESLGVAVSSQDCWCTAVAKSQLKEPVIQRGKRCWSDSAPFLFQRVLMLTDHPESPVTICHNSWGVL